MYSKTKASILFMGTPGFAVPCLQQLHQQGHWIVGVVTQPDRPQGRKKQLLPTPVKSKSLELGLPVYQPSSIKSTEVLDEIARLQPDLVVTAAYGQILPEALLSLPPFGCINVHASLLPKYRGGAPIHHAIMNGEKTSGVTIMYMERGLDTGDMINQAQISISRQDTVGDLFDRLSWLGAELLSSTLPTLLDGSASAIPQNHSEATYAPNIKKEDEQINWARSSEEIYNQVRGMNPWPGAYTLWDGKRLKIWKCLDPLQHTSASVTDSLPGTVLTVMEKGMEIRTGDGSIWVSELQPSGKKAMTAAQFYRGKPATPGTRFGGQHE